MAVQHFERGHLQPASFLKEFSTGIWCGKSFKKQHENHSVLLTFLTKLSRFQLSTRHLTNGTQQHQTLGITLLALDLQELKG